MHLELLTWVAQGLSSLEAGLVWFCSDEGFRHSVWRLLDLVREDTPDQGIVRVPPQISPPPGAPPKEEKEHREKEKEFTEEKKRKCDVCGKVRAEHPGRLFCKREKDSKKDRDRDDKRDSSGKGSKGKGGNKRKSGH